MFDQSITTTSTDHTPTWKPKDKQQLLAQVLSNTKSPAHESRQMHTCDRTHGVCWSILLSRIAKVNPSHMSRRRVIADEREAGVHRPYGRR